MVKPMKFSMDLAITIGSLHFSTLEILCIIMCPSYPETEEKIKIF
jgi:hypothetical protein